MSEDTELKPCPFCGGKATLRKEQFRYVSCENPRCDVVAEAGAFFSNEQEAITAWNTRPTEQAAAAKAVEAERARIVTWLEKERDGIDVYDSIFSVNKVRWNTLDDVISIVGKDNP